MKRFNSLLILCLLTSCESKEKIEQNRLKEDNLVVEEIVFGGTIESSVGEKQKGPSFPWRAGGGKNFAPITMDFFRCRGSSLNPVKNSLDSSGKLLEVNDCGGSLEHGLPLDGGQERIQPILITLLNHIQEKLDQRVVITSGHRCPVHNSYVDPSQGNQTSKHLLGAAVSFYVENLEESPNEVLSQLFSYYKNEPFKRWDKTTDVSTKPWYNDEVFVKLYKKDEGRDFDNRHPYPYISIQVRYDREKKEPVTYSYDKGHRNYLRK